MPSRKCLHLVVLLGVLSSTAAAQDAVESFWNAMLSTDFTQVEHHLPIEFVQAMTECDPSARDSFSSGLQLILDHRLEVSEMDASGRPDAIKFVDADLYQRSTIEVRIVSKFVTADRATLGLLMTASRQQLNGAPYVSQKSEVVTMILTDGWWRIVSVELPQAQETRLHRFDRGIETSCRQANESSAVGNLRSVNTAQVTYSSTYPDIGFFLRLSQAGPPADLRHPTAAASGILDGSIGCAVEPCLKSGYSFRIKAAATLPQTSYEAFARPIAYGKTGTRSFYTSEDGVIRFTSEDRDATRKDPSVDPAFQ